MKCPVCGEKTYVNDIVHVPDHSEVYRRRKCERCGAIVYTLEIPVEYDEELDKIWHKNYRKRRVK